MKASARQRPPLLIQRGAPNQVTPTAMKESPCLPTIQSHTQIQLILVKNRGSRGEQPSDTRSSTCFKSLRRSCLSWKVVSIAERPIPYHARNREPCPPAAQRPANPPTGQGPGSRALCGPAVSGKRVWPGAGGRLRSVSSVPDLNRSESERSRSGTTTALRRPPKVVKVKIRTSRSKSVRGHHRGDDHEYAGG
jgi:hypothetical protein